MPKFLIAEFPGGYKIEQEFNAHPNDFELKQIIAEERVEMLMAFECMTSKGLPPEVAFTVIAAEWSNTIDEIVGCAQPVRWQNEKGERLG
jgi:hypothetical protein